MMPPTPKTRLLAPKRPARAGGRGFGWYFALSGGAFTYLVAGYAAYHYTQLRKLPEPPAGIRDPAVQKDLVALDGPLARNNPFTRLAATYDDQIGWSETLMRLGRRRKNLLAEARGDVLELAAGTGRNLEVYPLGQLRSLHLSDRNERMLHEALQKQRALARRFALHNVEAFFALDDGEATSYADDSFDTVVDTFGLCSFQDPVAALREMARVCRPGGRILLLEHGASRFGWLSRVLDKTASDHAASWGCWWNRDILQLVSSAGLTPSVVRRYHFGTTYHIEIPVDA